MGIFKFIKQTIDEEYDLDNLEDFVYDDEPLLSDENVSEDEFSDGLLSLDVDSIYSDFEMDIDKKSSKSKNKKKGKSKEKDEAGREKNIENKKVLSKEEEKYDQLLNSLQAQNLINTVEQIKKEPENENVLDTRKQEVKIKKQQEKKKNIENNLVEGEDSLYIKNGKKRIDLDIDKGDIYKGDDENKNISTINNKIYRNVELPDVTRKPKEFDKVNTSNFKTADVEIFVKNQCDIMEEASSYVERAKMEYETVAEYYADTNKITDAPDDIRLKVWNAAERLENLSTDRRISRGIGNQLPMDVYRMIEDMEYKINDTIDEIQSQENNYENIKRDMRMLEAERINLKSDARTLVRRQLNIRSLAITSICCLAVVFIVFVIAMIKLNDDANTLLFIIVTGLAAALALGMFALLYRTEREVVIVENKINKATTLLNKVKIKYINAANTLDFEYNKYDISSSYELAEKYRLFKIMRQDQKHLVEMTSALSSAEKELEDLLNKLDLYDSHIWLSQSRAIINNKEMVEIRHKLSNRRQKLRTQIEYNEKRIDEAKSNIKTITVKNPQYAKDALRIVEMYEKKHAF